MKAEVLGFCKRPETHLMGKYKTNEFILVYNTMSFGAPVHPSLLERVR